MCIHSWNDLIDQTTPILPQIMETIMEKIGVCRLSIEHVTYERGTNKVMPHCVKRRPQNALSQEIVVIFLRGLVTFIKNVPGPFSS